MNVDHLPALHLVGGRGACLLGSALVSRSLDRGSRPVLVDLSTWTGGADVVLGIDHLDGVRWGDLADADGRLDPGGLARRLPVGDDGRCALAHARDGRESVSTQVLIAGLVALRQGFDPVITLASGPEPAAYAPGDEVVVVAESDPVGIASAVAAVHWLRDNGVDHRVLLAGGRPDRELLDRLPDEVGRLGVRRADDRDLARGRLCRGRGLTAVAEELLRDLDGAAVRSAA